MDNIKKAQQAAQQDLLLGVLHPQDVTRETIPEANLGQTYDPGNKGFSLEESLEGKPRDGFEKEYFMLSQKNKRQQLYKDYENKKIGYHDFLYEAYGKDIFLENGHDFENPMYWYNRYSQNNYSNPLENVSTMNKIYAQAQELMGVDNFQKTLNKNLSDSLLGTLTNVPLSTQQFKDLMSSEQNDKLAQQLGDWERVMKYYKAGLLSEFDPVIYDENKKAIAYFHTDGVLHKVDGKDATAFYNSDGSLDRITLNGSSGADMFHEFKSGFFNSLAGIIELPWYAVAGISRLFGNEDAMKDAYLKIELGKREGFLKHLVDSGVYSADSEFRNADGSIDWDNIGRGVANVAGGMAALVATAYIGGGFASAGQKALTTGTKVATKAGVKAGVRSAARKGIGYTLKYTGETIKALSGFRNGQLPGLTSKNLIANSLSSALVLTSRDAMEAASFLKARQDITGQSDEEIRSEVTKTSILNFAVSAAFRATLDDQGVMQRVNKVASKWGKGTYANKLGQWMVAHPKAVQYTNLFSDTFENALTMRTMQMLKTEGSVDEAKIFGKEFWSDPAMVFQTAIAAHITNRGMMGSGGLNTHGALDHVNAVKDTHYKVLDTFKEYKEKFKGKPEQDAILKLESEYIKNTNVGADANGNKLPAFERTLNALDTLHNQMAKADGSSLVSQAFDKVMTKAIDIEFNNQARLANDLYESSRSQARDLFKGILSKGRKLSSYQRMLTKIDAVKSQLDFDLNDNYLRHDAQTVISKMSKEDLKMVEEFLNKEDNGITIDNKFYDPGKEMKPEMRKKVESLIAKGLTEQNVMDGMIVKFERGRDQESNPVYQSTLDMLSQIAKASDVEADQGLARTFYAFDDDSFFINLGSPLHSIETMLGIREAVHAMYALKYGQSREAALEGFKTLQAAVGREHAISLLDDMVNSKVIPIQAAFRILDDEIFEKDAIAKSTKLARVKKLREEFENKIKPMLQTLDDPDPNKIRDFFEKLYQEPEITKLMQDNGMIDESQLKLLKSKMDKVAKSFFGQSPAKALDLASSLVDQLGVEKNLTSREKDALIKKVLKHWDFGYSESELDFLNRLSVEHSNDTLERAMFFLNPKDSNTLSNIMKRRHIKNTNLSVNKFLGFIKDVQDTQLNNIYEGLEEFSKLHYDKTVSMRGKNTVTLSLSNIESASMKAIYNKLGALSEILDQKDAYKTIFKEAKVSERQVVLQWQAAQELIQIFGKDTLTFNLESSEDKSALAMIMSRLGYSGINGINSISSPDGVYYNDQDYRAIPLEIKKDPEAISSTTEITEEALTKDLDIRLENNFGNSIYLDDDTEFSINHLLVSAINPETVEDEFIYSLKNYASKVKGARNTKNISDMVRGFLKLGYKGSSDPQLENVLLLDTILTNMSEYITDSTQQPMFREAYIADKDHLKQLRKIGWEFGKEDKSSNPIYYIKNFTYNRAAVADMLKTHSDLTDFIPLARDKIYSLQSPEGMLLYAKTLKDTRKGYVEYSLYDCLLNHQVTSDGSNSIATKMIDLMNGVKVFDFGKYTLDLPAKDIWKVKDFMALKSDSAFVQVARNYINLCKQASSKATNLDKILSIPKVYDFIKKHIKTFDLGELADNPKKQSRFILDVNEFINLYLDKDTTSEPMSVGRELKGWNNSAFGEGVELVSSSMLKSIHVLSQGKVKFTKEDLKELIQGLSTNLVQLDRKEFLNPERKNTLIAMMNHYKNADGKVYLPVDELYNLSKQDLAELKSLYGLSIKDFTVLKEKLSYLDKQEPSDTPYKRIQEIVDLSKPSNRVETTGSLLPDDELLDMVKGFISRSIQHRKYEKRIKVSQLKSELMNDVTASIVSQADMHHKDANNPGSITISNVNNKIELGRLMYNIVGVADSLSAAFDKSRDEMINVASDIYFKTSGTQYQSVYERYFFLKDGKLLNTAIYDKLQARLDNSDLLLKMMKEQDATHLIYVDKEGLSVSDSPRFNLVELNPENRKLIENTLYTETYLNHIYKNRGYSGTPEEAIHAELQRYNSVKDVREYTRDIIARHRGLTNLMSEELFQSLLDYNYNSNELSITEQAAKNAFRQQGIFTPDKGKRDNSRLSRIRDILQYGLTTDKLPEATVNFLLDSLSDKPYKAEICHDMYLEINNLYKTNREQNLGLNFDRLFDAMKAFKSGDPEDDDNNLHVVKEEINALLDTPIEKELKALMELTETPYKKAKDFEYDRLLRQSLHNPAIASFVFNQAADPKYIDHLTKNTSQEILINVGEGKRQIDLNKIAEDKLTIFDIETIKISDNGEEKDIPYQLSMYIREQGKDPVIKTFYLDLPGHPTNINDFVDQKATPGFKDWVSKDNRDEALKAWQASTKMKSTVTDVIKYLGETPEGLFMSYNGRNFDIPVLEEWFGIEGVLQSTLSTIKDNHIDMYHDIVDMYPIASGGDLLRTGQSRSLELLKHIIPEDVLEKIASSHNAEGDVQMTSHIFDWLVDNTIDTSKISKKVLDSIKPEYFKGDDPIDLTHLTENEFIYDYAINAKLIDPKNFMKSKKLLDAYYMQKEFTTRNKAIQKDINKQMSKYRPFIDFFFKEGGRHKMANTLDYIISRLNTYPSKTLDILEKALSKKFGKKYGTSYSLNDKAILDMFQGMTSQENLTDMLVSVNQILGKEVLNLRDMANHKGTRALQNFLKEMNADESFKVNNNIAYEAERVQKVTNAINPIAEVIKAIEYPEELAKWFPTFMENELATLVNRNPKYDSSGIELQNYNRTKKYDSKFDEYLKDYLVQNPYLSYTKKGFWNYVTAKNACSEVVLESGIKERMSSDTLYVGKSLAKKLGSSGYVSILISPSDKVDSSLIGLKLKVLDDPSSVVLATPEMLASRLSRDVDGDRLTIFPASEDQAYYYKTIGTNEAYTILDKLIYEMGETTRPTMELSIINSAATKVSGSIKEELRALNKGTADYKELRQIHAYELSSVVKTTEDIEELLDITWIQENDLAYTGGGKVYTTNNRYALLDPDLRAYNYAMQKESLKNSAVAKVKIYNEAQETGTTQKKFLAKGEVREVLDASGLDYCPLSFDKNTEAKINQWIKKAGKSSVLKTLRKIGIDKDYLKNIQATNALKPIDILYTFQQLECAKLSDSLEKLKGLIDWHALDTSYQDHIDSYYNAMHLYNDLNKDLPTDINIKPLSKGSMDAAELTRIKQLLLDNKLDKTKAEIFTNDYNDEMFRRNSIQTNVLVVDDPTSTESPILNKSLKSLPKLYRIEKVPANDGDKPRLELGKKLKRGDYITANIQSPHEGVYAGTQDGYHFITRSADISENTKVTGAGNANFKGPMIKGDIPSVKTISGKTIPSSDIMLKASSQIFDYKKESGTTDYTAEKVTLPDGSSATLLRNYRIAFPEDQSFYKEQFKNRKLDIYAVIANTNTLSGAAIFGETFFKLNDDGNLVCDTTQFTEINNFIARINDPEYVGRNALRLHQRMMLAILGNNIKDEKDKKIAFATAANNNLDTEQVWKQIFGLLNKHFNNNVSALYTKDSKENEIIKKLFSQDMFDRYIEDTATGLKDRAVTITSKSGAAKELEKQGAATYSKQFASGGSLPMINGNVPLAHGYLSMYDFIGLLNPKAFLSTDFTNMYLDCMNVGKAEASNTHTDYTYQNAEDMRKITSGVIPNSEGTDKKAGLTATTISNMAVDPGNKEIMNIDYDQDSMRWMQRQDKNYSTKQLQGAGIRRTPHRLFRYMDNLLSDDKRPANPNQLIRSINPYSPKEVSINFSPISFDINKSTHELYATMHRMTTGVNNIDDARRQLYKFRGTSAYHNVAEEINKTKTININRDKSEPDLGSLYDNNGNIIGSDIIRSGMDKWLAMQQEVTGNIRKGNIVNSDEIYEPIKTKTFGALLSSSGIYEDTAFTGQVGMAIRQFGGDARAMKGEMVRGAYLLQSKVAPIQKSFNDFIATWSKLDRYDAADAEEKATLLKSWGLSDTKELIKERDSFIKTYPVEANLAFETVTKIHTFARETAERVNEPIPSIYSIIELAMPAENGRAKDAAGTLKHTVSKMLKDPKENIGLGNISHYNFFESVDKVSERIAKAAALANLSDKFAESGALDNAKLSEHAIATVENTLDMSKLDIDITLKHIRSILHGKGFWIPDTLSPGEKVKAAFNLMNDLERNLINTHGIDPKMSKYDLKNLKQGTGDLLKITALEDITKIREAKQLLYDDLLQANPQVVNEILNNVRGHIQEGLSLVDKYGRKLSIDYRDRFNNLYPIHDMSLEYLRKGVAIAACASENEFNKMMALSVLSGDAYLMNKNLSDHMHKHFFTSKVPNKIIKLLKNVSQWTTKLLMSSAPKIIPRMLSFSSFDVAMGLSVTPKSLLYLPKAMREMSAFYQSKGATIDNSPELKAYLQEVGIDPINEEGYDIATYSEKIAGPEKLNKLWFNKIDKLFTYQTLYARYALWLAVKKSFENNKPIYGVAYGRKEAVDAMGTPEKKAMYVVDQTLGAPGGFPRIAKDLSGFAMFTTFPLAITRWGVEGARSIHRVASEALLEGFNLGHLRNLIIPGLSIAGTIALINMAISAISSLYNVDEEDEEDMKESSMFIDPVGTFLQNRPMPLYGNSPNPLQSLREMFIEPFTATQNDSIFKKLRGVLDANLIGKLNPIFKNPLEIFKGEDIIGPVRIKSSGYSPLENVARKVGGYAIGIGGSSALVRSWQQSGVDKEQGGFYQRLADAAGAAISAEIGNTKGYKQEVKNYRRALKLVNGQIYTERAANETNYSDFNKKRYGDLKTKLYRALNDNAKPSVIYGYIDQAVSNGATRSEISAALRASSISGRLNLIKDKDLFLASLSDKERRTLESAIKYEQNTYPVINEILPKLADTYSYKSKYGYIPRAYSDGTQANTLDAMSMRKPYNRSYSKYVKPTRFFTERKKYKKYEPKQKVKNLYVPSLREKEKYGKPSKPLGTDIRKEYLKTNRNKTFLSSKSFRVNQDLRRRSRNSWRR